MPIKLFDFDANLCTYFRRIKVTSNVNKERCYKKYILIISKSQIYPNYYKSRQLDEDCKQRNLDFTANGIGNFIECTHSEVLGQWGDGSILGY